MGNFLKKILGNRTTKPEDVYRSIINKVMQKGEKPEAIDDLDELTYDSEKLMDKNIFVSHIYIFEYDALKPTKYEYHGLSVFFADPMPIVLVTNISGETISGINLNFCNKDLKSIVLDMVASLDEDFFTSKAAEMVANKSIPLSMKLYKFFLMGGEKQMIKHLQMAYKGVDYSMIFRTYDVKHIKNLRLIEPWQWADLPLLERTALIKEDTLKALWKISGVDKVHI